MLWNPEKNRIRWITTPRHDESEWTDYTKTFIIRNDVKEAVFRLECDCTCAVTVNGEFIVSATGRLPERVNCHEVTGRLKPGENTIRLSLGGAYFQEKGANIARERGYRLSSAALELCVAYIDGTVDTLATDETWKGSADGAPCETLETMRVTDAEYDMMWKNAALWVEPERHQPTIPPEVLAVAGQAYAEYASAPAQTFAEPQKIYETNMKKVGDALTKDPANPDAPYAVYDFGRLAVGWLCLDYAADADTDVTLQFDFTESPADFSPEASWRDFIKNLSVKETLCAKETNYMLLRRRAFRFVKVIFPENTAGITLKAIRLKLCMFPETARGWFSCSDDLLNQAWQVGKYTLQVNKQQEYESCPRNEMEFFAGDGALDALVDFYAFGSMELLNTSLSLKEDVRCGGITYTPLYNKSVIQWDYFGWRIICMDIFYRATGDKDFLRRYYDEGKTALLWQLERVNAAGLMFQKPCFVSTYGFALGQTDWTCSPARLGEKVALNALLYKSLVIMADLALVMGETDNAEIWKQRAEDVKKAINDRLWSEEKQAYFDSLDEFLPGDGNTLAVLFGIADEPRAQAVLNTMKEKLWSPYGSAMMDRPVPHSRGGSNTIAPLMNAYECEARFLYGRPEEALDLLRRCWGTMLKKGAETFWEFSPNNGTDRWDIPSHAWSSGCTYLLSKYTLGLRFEGPRAQKLIFAPHPCDLDSMAGVVPTEKGFVAASFSRTEENGRQISRFRLAVPKTMCVETRLPENSTVEILTY